MRILGQENQLNSY